MSPTCIDPSAKVCREHLERSALVYVRQSSYYQVAHNLESQRRQYDLRHRAVALGWPAERVVVVDEDQGMSSRDPGTREAFTGLCLAQTGMMSMLPVFWTLPTSFLTGTAAAGGIALINSVGNIGGLLGANILGWFGSWCIAGCLVVGAALVLGMRESRQN